MDNSIHKSQEVNQSVLELIVDKCLIPLNVLDQKIGVNLYGLTEYSCKGMTFRANPCYKNEMPWYDWVLIAWDVPESRHKLLFNQDTYPDYVEVPDMTSNNGKSFSIAMLIPAKLICIIQEDSGEVFAIVHSCLQYCKKLLF